MKLFSISTAAREADVSVDTLRSYTNQGLIECERLENGTRIFNEAGIAKSRLLSALRAPMLPEADITTKPIMATGQQ